MRVAAVILVSLLGCNEPVEEEPHPYFLPMDEYVSTITDVFCAKELECYGSDYDDCVENAWNEEAIAYVKPCYSGTLAVECLGGYQDFLDDGTCEIPYLDACRNVGNDECGGSNDNGDEQTRLDYEARFPAAYCAWLEACVIEQGERTIPEDCVDYYTSQMEAERQHHDCYDPSGMQGCLDHLESTTCEARRDTRPRPDSCWNVTWVCPPETEE